jgi:hypothetical protein
MSIGRRGWTGCTRPGANIEIWCSIGHGHGSVRSLVVTRPVCGLSWHTLLQVYDVVLALLSVFCVPQLCPGFPVPYRA